MQKAYYRILLTTYAAAVVVGAGFQTILRLRYLNPVTGFYNNKPMVSVLYGILAVVVALWFIMTMLHRTGNEYPLYRFRGPARALSVLCGLSISACAVYYGMENLPVILHRLQAVNQKAGVWDTFLAFTVTATGVLGGIGMVWFALRKAGSSRGNLLGIFPAIWQLILLLGRYKRIPTLIYVSENLYVVLFMCFSTVFLLGQARSLCGFRPPSGRDYAIPTGLAASLFGFLLVVPAVAALISGGAVSALGDYHPVYAVYITVLTLYQTVFLVDYIRSIKLV